MRVMYSPYIVLLVINFHVKNFSHFVQDEIFLTMKLLWITVTANSMIAQLIIIMCIHQVTSHSDYKLHTGTMVDQLFFTN